jgi:hypothetical protein
LDAISNDTLSRAKSPGQLCKMQAIFDELTIFFNARTAFAGFIGAASRLRNPAAG